MPSAAAAALALTALCGMPAHAAADFPVAVVQEPRAFGYFVGDVVTRTIAIDLPADLRLEEASLPRIGRRGAALELRSVAWRARVGPGGRRHELTLQYQVFVAPREARVFEMPPFTLRFAGRPRTEALRIDAWPVTVAPLAAAEVSPRHGLGELRPDAAPPPIGAAAARLRLTGYAIAAMLLLTWLALVHVGLPWQAARRQPFSRAWRAVRGLSPASSAQQRRDAFRRMHDALNRTAGQAVFEHGIDRFVAAQPRYARLRDDLALFFRRSREEFFADPDGDPPPGRVAGDDAAAPPGAGDRVRRDARWLVELCRRCRDIERGAA